MKLELRKSPSKELSLFLNGRSLGPRKHLYLSDYGKGVSVSVYHSKITEKLLACSFSDIPEEIVTLKLYYPSDNSLVSEFEFRRIEKDWETWVSLSLDGENWKNRWTITEYCDAAIELADADGKETDYDNEFYGNKFEVLVTDQSPAELSQAVESATNEWNDFHSRLVSTLENAVVVEFKFPPEIRVPCEQYLQYFGQFLRDLGVNSDTSIRHDGAKTILSSSPFDKRDALEKIRHALGIYLKLSVSTGDAQNDSPASAHQLIANIHHLRGQLTLAHATLEAKNATILAQHDSLQVVQSLIAEAMSSKSMKKDASETLLGGILTLGKTDPKYGLSVSWAELFRRLKVHFGKNPS